MYIFGCIWLLAVKNYNQIFIYFVLAHQNLLSRARETYTHSYLYARADYALWLNKYVCLYVHSYYLIAYKFANISTKQHTLMSQVGKCEAILENDIHIFIFQLEKFSLRNTCTWFIWPIFPEYFLKYFTFIHLLYA